MTLTQLKYFLALCESGTFANAADQCFVSQPTLSLQVKKLETFVGVALIDRSQSPIKPTAFGLEFAQQARAVFGEVSKLEALFEQESPNLEGHLTLGCIPTIAYYLMLPLVQGFQERYPALKIQFLEIPTHEILDRLESGFLDVAVLAGPIPNRHLHEQHLYYEPFALLPTQRVAGEFSKASLDILKQIPLLMLGEDHCLRGQTINICKHFNRSSGESSIECSSIGMMKAFVQANIASAVLPELCVQGEQYLPLINPKPGRVVSMVHRKNYHKTRTLDAVSSLVLEQIPSSYKSKQGLKIIGIDHDSIE